MLTSCLFDFPPCLIKDTKGLKRIAIHVFTADSFDTWLANQDTHIKHQIDDMAFNAKSGEFHILRNTDGRIDSILAGVSDSADLYDIAALPAFLNKKLSKTVLSASYFGFDLLCEKPLESLILGWTLGNYNFDLYQRSKETPVRLHVDHHDDLVRPLAFTRAITLLRNMVNAPANDLGPAEIEQVAAELANLHKAKIKTTKGSALVKGFPLVHTVGQAACKERAPRLIEMHWGSKDNPHIVLVGKGVCFDTGGLDLKPPQYMGLMKKDMGGSAHVLALADLIMALGLPVRLSVIIPAVENAVSGNAFRPGDIITSRKGLTVENTDTDAEGRLILADALAYASELEPDLIIDFATLTGSARAALGPDIPAVFTNDPVTEDQLRHIPHSVFDTVWPMPLHEGYKESMKSPVADITNHISVPGDLIYSAIFLQHFVGGDTYTPKWVHVDCFAWENNGRPGRPKGGKDTGLRAMFALLEENYR